jgi:hypothetical protein
LNALDLINSPFLILLTEIKLNFFIEMELHQNRNKKVSKKAIICHIETCADDKVGQR